MKNNGKNLAHIFESYYTTKPPEKGTGLGFPVVKQIIESNGGTLSVNSEPDKGSTFFFELPVIPKSADNGNDSLGGISQ